MHQLQLLKTNQSHVADTSKTSVLKSLMIAVCGRNVDMYITSDYIVIIKETNSNTLLFFFLIIDHLKNSKWKKFKRYF